MAASRIRSLAAGRVGQVLAAKLAEVGHEVVIGTRDPAATLAREEPDGYGNPPFRAWHSQHPDVKLGSFADAAAHGELVVNATAGAASLDALRLAGEPNLHGKVLVDIANALDFSRGMPPSTSRWSDDLAGLLLGRMIDAIKPFNPAVIQTNLTKDREVELVQALQS